MTEKELEGIAWQALNMAKRDLEQGREFSALLGTYHEGEGLRRMEKLEKIIVDKLGREWLNDGAAKDAAFDVIRLATQVMPPDAFIFVCAVNMFKPTEKFDVLPFAEQRRLLANRGHDADHRMVARGLLTLHDGYAVTAQTQEQVCIVTQLVGPDGEWLDAPTTQHCSQDEFEGRMKIFGKLQ